MNHNDTLQEYKTELGELQFEQAENPTQDRQDRINWLTNKISEIEFEHGIQQERVQAQEEKISSITLPYDFNEVFGDPRANDIVTELIQQFQREAYAEHNEEIAKLNAETKEKLRAAEEREIEYKYQNDQLQHDNRIQLDQIAVLQETLEEEKRANTEALNLLNETKIRMNEIETNRGNAARELEQAQAEIKRLNENLDLMQKEKALGAREAYKVHDVGTSDKLSTLVQQSLADKAKSAYDRFLERNKDVAQELDLKPIVLPEVQPEGGSFRLETPALESGVSGIPVAEVPEIKQVTGEDFRPVSDQGTEQAVPETSAAESNLGGVAQQTVTREEFEAFKADVNRKFAEIMGDVA